MSESINPAFRAQVDRKLDDFIARYRQGDPYTSKQPHSREMHLEYYKRDLIEVVLRIRMRRIIDALVIHYFTKHDPVQAKRWSKYTEEEMLHDTLFAKDLERLGLQRESIYGHEPFLSTKLLQGYLYYTLETEGPRGTLVYSYSVEYTSRKTQPARLAQLEQLLGREMIHGARTHLNYDIEEDHSHFVWNVLMSQVKSPDDERRVLDHMDDFFGLLCGYSHELYTAAVKAERPTPADTLVNIVSAAAPEAG